MSLNIRWFFSLIQMILLYFILFSDFSGDVLVADGVEHIFMCLLIIYMCVCVYTHIFVCVKCLFKFLPRVLLSFLLTINFQGSHLYILKSSLSSCILIIAISSCSGDFLVDSLFLLIYLFIYH